MKLPYPPTTSQSASDAHGEPELREVNPSKSWVFLPSLHPHPSFRQLICESLELVNFRRFGKQIAGLRLFHQSRCHRAFEMRIAPGFAVERVKDGKG